MISACILVIQVLWLLQKLPFQLKDHDMQWNPQSWTRLCETEAMFQLRVPAPRNSVNCLFLDQQVDMRK